MKDHTPPDYRWCLFYEDGTRFSSHDGEPWESPPWGVILIAQPQHQWDLLQDRDFYLWRADLDTWMVTDYAGLLDQLSTRAKEITCFRVGRLIPVKEEWQRIHKAIVKEVRGR